MNLYLYDQKHENIISTLPLEDNMSLDALDSIIHFLEENRILDSYKTLIIAKGYERINVGEGFTVIIFQY